MRTSDCKLVCAALLAAVVSAAAVEMDTVSGVEFKVRKERPRVFFRPTEWTGPSVDKLKRWIVLPEYRQRGIEKYPAFEYLATGDREKGRAALADFAKQKISGRSPSYSGNPAQVYAALYDWLRNHPDFDDAARKAAVAHMEEWGETFSQFITEGNSSIYYSRYPGAIAGLTAIGLALHGDSPKADGFIRLAHKSLLEYGKARQYEDGSAGGGNYSIVHAFPDLARAVVAFESATDAGVLEHIRKKQGDWIRRQLEWQIWWTFPTGYFVKEGDFWRIEDKLQARANIDILTHLLHDGHGRTFADQMHKRHGMNDYHGGYVWDFFVFNNPEIPPKPLAELGNATIFGKESRGYVLFRGGWERDDPVVFFKCGESLDTHGSNGTAHFDVWRRRSLAQRAGPWYNVNTGGGNTWHCNTMTFVSEGDDGKHPVTVVKESVALDFDAFLQWTRKRAIEAGNIVEFDPKDGQARVLADATAAVSRSCKSWTRELVWLGNRYLLVIDRVETLPKPVKQRWMLYLLGERTLEGRLATASLGGSKLYCRTLLPEDAKLAWVEVKDAGTRLEVTPPDDSPGKRIYVHAITAGPADAAEPETSLRKDGDKLTVTIGGLSHTLTQ